MNLPNYILAQSDILYSGILEEMSAGLSSADMSFPEFLREGWPIIEPANPLISSWYTDLLCEYLQLVTEGEIQKLLINMPPRNAKSNIVTILWPVWSWTKKPWLRWIFCSYSASLSVKHSIDRRRIIESDWFIRNWGSVVKLAEDQNQKHEYQNTQRGHMISTSVGGTITGKGGDVVVEDDMLNPQEAESDAARSHSISMHKNVLSSRLDNPRTGARVVVEQRTHDKDLTGHILRNETGWTHLVLPLRAEKRTIITFPVSKREVVREAGEFLNPQRQAEKEHDELKQAMGTRTFVAQCQQNPTAEEGNILKRHWWKFWHKEIPGADITIQSWDMTFKKTEDGSFVVGQVWKVRGPNFYLIDQFRDRVDFSDTIPAMLSLSGKYPAATAKLVEEAANGPAIISQLQNKIPGIVPVKPLGSKIARAQAMAPFVEAGNIFLPDPMTNPWVYDLIEEAAAFKGQSGEINDQVDAMSQAINWLHKLNTRIAPVDEGLGDSFLDQDEMVVAGGFR